MRVCDQPPLPQVIGALAGFKFCSWLIRHHVSPIAPDIPPIIAGSYLTNKKPPLETLPIYHMLHNVITPAESTVDLYGGEKNALMKFLPVSNFSLFEGGQGWHSWAL